LKTWQTKANSQNKSILTWALSKVMMTVKLTYFYKRKTEAIVEYSIYVDLSS